MILTIRLYHRADRSSRRVHLRLGPSALFLCQQRQVYFGEIPSLTSSQQVVPPGNRIGLEPSHFGRYPRRPCNGAEKMGPRVLLSNPQRPSFLSMNSSHRPIIAALYTLSEPPDEIAGGTGQSRHHRPRYISPKYISCRTSRRQVRSERVPERLLAVWCTARSGVSRSGPSGRGCTGSAGGFMSPTP